MNSNLYISTENNNNLSIKYTSPLISALFYNKICNIILIFGYIETGSMYK